MPSFSSYIPFVGTRNHAPDAPPAPGAGDGVQEQENRQRDPESQRFRPKKSSIQNSLLNALNLNRNPGTDAEEEEQNRGLSEKLNDAYAQVRDQVSATMKALLEQNEDIKAIKAGDRCVNFTRFEMFDVSLNAIANVGALTLSTATSFGLINRLAPASAAGLASQTIAPPGTIPPATAGQTSYSWTDMGKTVVLGTNHFFINTAYKELILGAMKACLLKGKHDPVSAQEANFHKYLKEEYEPYKDNISPDFQRAIDNAITRITTLYDWVRPEKDKPTNMNLNGLEDTLTFIGLAEYWLKSFLPFSKQEWPLKEVPDWRDRQKIEDKLLATEPLLKVYSNPLTRSQMRHFPLSHGCRSIETNEYLIPQEMLDRPLKKAGELTMEDDWHHFHAIPDLPQKNTMMVGPPGSAKSYFKKVLNFWEIPYYTQTYKSLIKGGVAAGEPAQWRALFQRKYLTREGDLLGERVFKMFGKGCRNAVRILDEPNWDDVDGAKRDTDPFTEKLETECLEAFYRIAESQTLTMCNSVPTVKKLRTATEIVEEIDPAFLSRNEIVLVEQPDQPTMREIAIEAYKGFAARFCLPFADGSPARLDEEKQERLQSAFKSVVDLLVEHHDTKKGELRLYTDVEPIFMEIVSRLMLEGAEGHPRMENEGIRQYVLDYFGVIPNRNPNKKHEAAEQAAANAAQDRPAEERNGNENPAPERRSTRARLSAKFRDFKNSLRRH